MVTRVSVDEVTEFRTAVAGVEIDWVRIDRGWGPAFMVSSGKHDVAVSYGGLDFSTIMHTQVPDDSVAFQLVTRAPDGMRWCGSEADDMDLRSYRPSMSVMANVPAGSRAVTMVAELEALLHVADDLGLPQFRIPASTDALPRTPEVWAMNNDLVQIAAAPDLLETPTGTTRLLESTARALASVQSARSPAARGFDSRGIVTACLDYVEATGVHQPAISELCRAAYASESRLRQAFVEVLGVPPTQYFQLRVLSRLRNELLTTNPGESTVTRAATSLGLTQLGRVAGRYRAVFGETPRDTLQRHESRRF